MAVRARAPGEPEGPPPDELHLSVKSQERSIPFLVDFPPPCYVQLHLRDI
jgi:hypothetical protein